MIYECKDNSKFWLNETVDALLDYIKDFPDEAKNPITCAAGMTPSAPIHFGILREIAISYFVAEELKKRGFPVRLVYYWDDYDHFCKIPYFKTKEEVAEHIGKRLHYVPDFLGGRPSYGQHIMEDFEKVLSKCGFFPEYDYQSIAYTEGKYFKHMKYVIENRHKIFDILNEDKKPYTPEMEEVRKNYYPFEVYCSECGTDKAKVTDYNKETRNIKYHCNKCGNDGSYILGENFEGKLIWKLNWAMRWFDDSVCYESSGENQLTDTGSYSVASKIVTELFGGRVPFSLLYRFIGAPGIAKVSRAQGKDTLAEKFSDVVEPQIIRWLLVKNPPQKNFTVDMNEGIFRLYNEWDKFEEKVLSGEDCTDLDKEIYSISCKDVKKSELNVGFKKLTTVLAIANNNFDLAIEMLCHIQHFDITKNELKEKLKPRMDCASAWLYKYDNIQQEPKLRTTFDSKSFNSFSPELHFCLYELAYNLSNTFDENDYTDILYSIPKMIEGDPAKLKKLQKEFFTALYKLLFGTERGPKLGILLGLIDTKILNVLIKGD